MKNPILLPSKLGFTEFWIKERRAAVHHDGTSETLAAVRDKFWIVKGCNIIKGVSYRCVACRQYDGNQ